MKRQSYYIEIDCPTCGARHLVASRYYLLSAGPTEAGSLAELYTGRELPPELARLMKDAIWCAEAGGYLEQSDPARWHIWPNA